MLPQIIPLPWIAAFVIIFLVYFSLALILSHTNTGNTNNSIVINTNSTELMW